METSILNGMCRCCALEGTFKDLKCTYHWMGEQEIYGDMLKECFNIDLSNEDGTDSGICEVCITQLRNAVNFKKQVLFTEEQFKKKVQGKFFKANIVKLEVQQDEADSDDNDNNLSTDEAFSNTEFEVPIKMEEPEEPKAKKRAAAKATTSRAKKAKTDAGETSKRNSGGTTLVKSEPHTVSTTKTKRIIKPTKEWSLANKHRLSDHDYSYSVKSNKSSTPEVDKALTNITEEIGVAYDWGLANKDKGHKISIKDEDNSVHDRTMTKDLEKFAPDKEEINKHLENINTLLQYTNATLIKTYSTGFGYVCWYCPEAYKIAADLKRHTQKEHPDRLIHPKKGTDRYYSAREFLAKLDITSLICVLCDEPIDSLDKAVDHLVTVHDKTFHIDIKNQIIPFKFGGKKLKCVVCDIEFNNFKMLLNHMNRHYGNYQCLKCNLAFVNYMILRMHYRTHIEGNYKCKYCEKVFASINKRTMHERSVHVVNHKRNKCPHCGEMFVDYSKRNDHMVEVHGEERQEFKCNACDAVYNTQKSLTFHVKTYHLMIRNVQCKFCDKKFASNHRLKNHMLTHNGRKDYMCEFCLKSYGKRSTLKEHYRIHYDDRRFKCEYCGLTFIQKCSLKSHLSTKHSDKV